MNMNTDRTRTAVILAAALWFVMFSPWTAPHVFFWPVMAASCLTLASFGLWAGGSPFGGSRRNIPMALAAGTAIAAVLWGVFWLGDKVSQWMFSFAGRQIDMIYDMKDGTPPWTIGLLLLLVIGPCEELFWRGYVQRQAAGRLDTWKGFLLTWLCYTAIHIWSGNVMLLLAACACGFCWGMLYALFPRRLDAIVLSHALWDVAAFVLFPF